MSSKNVVVAVSALPTILDILLRFALLAPSIGDAYRKIIDALHKDGQITTDEWTKRKAGYITEMGSDAWQTDPPVVPVIPTE